MWISCKLSSNIHIFTFIKTSLTKIGIYKTWKDITSRHYTACKHIFKTNRICKKSATRKCFSLFPGHSRRESREGFPAAGRQRRWRAQWGGVCLRSPQGDFWQKILLFKLFSSILGCIINGSYQWRHYWLNLETPLSPVLPTTSLDVHVDLKKFSHVFWTSSLQKLALALFSVCKQAIALEGPALKYCSMESLWTYLAIKLIKM